jgi:serine/threonine-protein kinase RsbW
VSVLPAEVIRLDIPATHKHLTILGACISQLLAHVDSIDDRELLIYTVQLAAHEACANIIDHAYAGEPGHRIMIDLTLNERPRGLTIELHDTGRSFDIGSIPEPKLAEAHDHGYGLFLMRNLMDEVTYASGPAGNYWSLVKYL